MKWKANTLSLRSLLCMPLTLIMLSTSITSAVIPVKTAYGEAAVNEQQVRTARSYQATLSDWKRWAADHAYALHTIQPESWSSNGGSIGQDKFSDLDILIPLLADKRIVYLGENSHGVAEFNLVKTRLIQYMHQTLGFNIVAFESGLGDAALGQGRIKRRRLPIR